MKYIFQKWWKEKQFSIINYRKSWKENGNKPRIYFHWNHARKGIDSCFDASLIVGYTVFNYTNFDYRGEI